jgi:hypothetical protein
MNSLLCGFAAFQAHGKYFLRLRLEKGRRSLKILLKSPVRQSLTARKAAKPLILRRFVANRPS